MSKNIHVAIASTTSLPGQLDRSLEQIADFAKRAGDEAVELLLTHELSASGYGGFPEVITTAGKAGDGRIYHSVAKLADKTRVNIFAIFA